MPMRNAGTGPPVAPTLAEAYAWPSRPAVRKAKCIISRSISRLGIEWLPVNLVCKNYGVINTAHPFGAFAHHEPCNILQAFSAQQATHHLPSKDLASQGSLAFLNR